MKNLEFISIRDILNKEFIIPSYQVGYYWDEKQISELLNGIFEFQKKRKNKGEFYSLQPIVVIRRDKGVYELIDGQQILITLHILLSFFEDAMKSLFNTSEKLKISYEAEEENSKQNFLNKINETRCVNNENADLYHMRKAYLFIQEWHEANFAKIDFVGFLNTLLNTCKIEHIDIAHNVRFLWHELQTEDVNDVKTIFTRKAKKRIPLSSTDLIKSLFLMNENPISKETEKQTQKRAYEWNAIEEKLENIDFMLFNHQPDEQKQTRLGFILELIARKYDKNTTIEPNNKSIGVYYAYCIINNLINNDLKTKDELWEEIKSYNKTYEKCNTIHACYHLIDYLLYVGKDITEIEELSNNKTESMFKEALIALIKDVIRVGFGRINIFYLLKFLD